MTRTTDTIHTRNTQTGKPECIHQYDITLSDWGFWFSVKTELEAFKAAYAYRNSPHGTEVKWSPGMNMWIVTVFSKNISPGTSR